MVWVILVNRKLAKPEVYGPYGDYKEVCDVERKLAEQIYVKSTLIVELVDARLAGDSTLVRTAYL